MTEEPEVSTDPEVDEETPIPPGQCARCGMELADTVWWETEDADGEIHHWCHEHYVVPGHVWTDTDPWYMEQDPTTWSLSHRKFVVRSLFDSQAKPPRETREEAHRVGALSADQRIQWVIAAYVDGYYEGLRDAGRIVMPDTSGPCKLSPYEPDAPTDAALVWAVPEQPLTYFPQWAEKGAEP